MKYYTLSQEEKKELDAIENGEYTPVKDLDAAKKQATQSAKATLNKNKNINIRLTQADLMKLKSKAVEEGLPYQTLASSILHKAVK